MFVENWALLVLATDTPNYADLKRALDRLAMVLGPLRHKHSALGRANELGGIAPYETLTPQPKEGHWAEFTPSRRLLCRHLLKLAISRSFTPRSSSDFSVSIEYP